MAKSRPAANAARHASTASGQQSERGARAAEGTDAETVASAVGRGNLSQAAAQATEGVQQTISGVGDQLRQQASGQLQMQKDRAAGGLELVAELLRQAGEQVREQDQVPVAASIDGVADRVEHWSDSLRTKDVSQLGDELKELARRQPVLFVGGALALGFASVRFFKSSASGASASQEHEPASSVLHDLADLEQVLPPASQTTASAETR